MKKIIWKYVFISAGVVLLISLIGFLLSMNSENVYRAITLPAFAPPTITFSIVWPILYIILGISLYLIISSNSTLIKPAIEIFFIQIIVNLLWPLIFFILKLEIVGLFVLFTLNVLIILMIKIFTNVNKTAGYIQIPYLIWSIFATAINFGIVVLN